MIYTLEEIFNRIQSMLLDRGEDAKVILDLTTPECIRDAVAERIENENALKRLRELNDSELLEMYEKLYDRMIGDVHIEAIWELVNDLEEEQK